MGKGAWKERDRTGEVWELEFRVGHPKVLIVGPPTPMPAIFGSGVDHPIVDLETGRLDKLPEFRVADWATLAMRRVL